MRRVGITGLGIVSSLGHDVSSVWDALRTGRSGVRAMTEWDEFDMRSRVGGALDGFPERLAAAEIPRRIRIGLSEAGQYACVAALDAVADAGLAPEALADVRTSCLIGSSVSDGPVIHDTGVKLHGGKARRVRPQTAVKTMISSPVAGVAQLLGIGGPSYSVGAACATSAHTLGLALDQLRAGRIDRAVVGGCEAFNPLVTVAFDALRTALSDAYNDRPTEASRPFDAGRDGFVVSGGAGMVVLEPLDEARARGARVYGELLGYGATTDDTDVVLPAQDGGPAAASMRLALIDARLAPADIDYVNAHATSTVLGDRAEVEALRSLFGAACPPFSSTKSLGGHPIGAAGAIEVIHCLGMLDGRFVAASANVETPDEALRDLPLATQTREDVPLRHVLTNSFGFGGTNATLVLGAAS